jgi:thiamine-monophosphate kinase
MRDRRPFKSEAEFISWILRQAGRNAPRQWTGLSLGIGDDAALVRVPAGPELILTSDLSIEGVHFTAALHPPESVGHRALARSLSDIAAMGGTPRYALISLAISPCQSRTWLKGFFGGLFALARRFRVALIGGDTSLFDGPCTIDAIVAGEVRRGHAVRRSGARPGDLIYVSGMLGMSALGLRTLQQRSKSRKTQTKLPNSAERAALRAHLFPGPQCVLGQFISRRRLASAMMDLSDGLSLDLRRLCEASGVGATIFAGHLPAPPVADPSDALALALHGGEDYQLLFTVPKPGRSKVPNRFARTPLHCIGEIQATRAVTLVTPSGKPQPFEPGGYDHFARRTQPDR